MGIYNHLRIDIDCPRCHAKAPMLLDLYFGLRDLLEYRIGDPYAWVTGKAPPHGGRPEGGNVDGEAYSECPVCRKDSYFKVRVRNDVIVGVDPDPTRKPHIPD